LILFGDIIERVENLDWLKGALIGKSCEVGAMEYFVRGEDFGQMVGENFGKCFAECIK